MAGNITGKIDYNDLQHYSYLIEPGKKSLLAVDVQPFNSFGPQDARFAYDYLNQKNIPNGATITITGERKQINNYPFIVIVDPSIVIVQP